MIELNGKTYPFKFTYKCMRELMIKGESMSEIQQSEHGFILAINKGYEREGSKERITLEQLLQILDEDQGAFKKLTDALSADMGELTGGEPLGK